MENKTETIAKACYEMCRLWGHTNMGETQKNWEDAEQQQRDSVIRSVEVYIKNPIGYKHDLWMVEKAKDGINFRYVGKSEKKNHPCVIPFEKSPDFQQEKYALFCTIVDALK